jgi:hypothetical protein
MQFADPFLDGRAQRQQPSDPSNYDRDRVHVEAAHLLDAGRHRRASRQTGGIRRRQLAADRVKQERARAAGRVKHTLRQRLGEGARRYFESQPIRCVILAKVMSLSGVD